MNRYKLGGIGAGFLAVIALLVGMPMLLGRPAPPPVSAPTPVVDEEELPTQAEDPAEDDGDEDPGQPPTDPFVVPPERTPQQPENTGTPPTGSQPPVDPGPGPTPPVDPDPDPDPETPPPDPDPEPTGPLTVVSLTFDDGLASQLAAASILDDHGMSATFYVNSGTIGLGGYLGLSDLQALAASGHEIGGHTVTHADLAALPLDEVTRQICDDRTVLLDWGFAVRSFAYPFASASDDAEAQVSACGYNSGRMLGDIRSPHSCGGCDPAESIPPGNPAYLRAPDQFESDWTLATLQGAVVAAETTGGWLPLTFHDVCTTSCGQLSISQTLLDEFLDWLAARGATVNTVVRTVGDVVGGPVQPAVSAPSVPPPAPSGSNGIVNPSLEQASGGVPTCWYRAPWGSNSPEWELTPIARTGSVASLITMSDYASGDAKILPVFDLGACAPSVAAGESYSLRAWYASTTVTQFAVYLRTTQGGWVYWTSSPWFAPADVYTEAEWTTGPIPDGYNGISFGLNIFSDGVLVTDDYALYNSVGAPPVATEPSTIAPLPVEEPLPFTTLVAPDELVADPATEPAVEEPPAEEPPVEEPPAGTPIDEPSAEQGPAAVPPADAPPEPAATEPPPAAPPPVALEPAAPPAEEAIEPPAPPEPEPVAPDPDPEAAVPLDPTGT